MTGEDYIIENIRADGYRITKARRSILGIFMASDSPLSVAELLSSLMQMKINVNRTTVYREIDFLRERNLIREVQIGDRLRRYEFQRDDHHHHIICLTCKKVECIELDRCMETEEAAVSKKSSFRVIRHSLKFYGICAQCQ